jgi:hypothetical protein
MAVTGSIPAIGICQETVSPASLTKKIGRSTPIRWATSIEDGDIVLTAVRKATKGNPEPEFVLFTVPELQYCERRKDFSLTIMGLSKLWFQGNAQCVPYDFCAWNWDEERYEFYHDDECVAYVKCESFRLTAPEKPEPSGAEYRLASVRFHGSGRTYDYICDLEDVQVGDTVVVAGYDGETEVKVTKLTARRESELGLPVERYKKIIRKSR